MLRFAPQLPEAGTVLCLGAHSDDIEIGCGGLLMTLLQRHPHLKFHWVVFSGDEVRERETRAAAARLMEGGDVTLTTHKFRVSYFPHSGPAIKDTFEALRARLPDPDLILTHYLTDRHQDHRVLAELTWNTYRGHAVLEYEIPKYDGDLAHPSVFCPVSEALVEKKVSTLLDCFASQRNHQWFDADLFRGHMRLRGIECNSPTRFAEAFHARKLVIT
jgi:LmbE family N-acetylglucosaminyl deacetylase